MDDFAEGSPTSVIDADRAGRLLDGMLERLGRLRRVLLIPPDITRRASGAGELTVMLYERLAARNADVVVLPALGTHAAMNQDQLGVMFPGVPAAAFREHNWRGDLATLGEVPGAFVARVTEGLLDFPIRCEVNRLLIAEPWDRILSIGQLVPHEVVGIANHSKNIFVGLGGADVINKTHFVGAVCGMERIIGRPQSPVRDVLNHMAEHLAADLPISYVLTVRGRNERGGLVTRGLVGGDDTRCFERGAALAQRVNLDLLDRPLRKAVVYLDQNEYRSTWLGNKAIYRTRMAMADGGDLIILAPGVITFGEDPEIDRLIRKFGYHGTSRTLQAVAENDELRGNLAAAAHLIHGSTEGRFRVTYCTDGLSQSEIEGVGYAHQNIRDAIERFSPAALRDGWNTTADGEEFFYISIPGQGLWALRARLDDQA